MHVCAGETYEMTVVKGKRFAMALGYFIPVLEQPPRQLSRSQSWCIRSKRGATGDRVFDKGATANKSGPSASKLPLRHGTALLVLR